ncbi:hypothetical protein [Nostoc linckia]|nr:hypothetical protein [Nostoc linckia]
MLTVDCSMPNAQCPMPNAQLTLTFACHIYPINFQKGNVILQLSKIIDL